MLNRKKLSQIKCLVAEVDGVLSDGYAWVAHDGKRRRQFSVRDEIAIRRLIKAGYTFVVVSQSSDEQVIEHFQQLGVNEIHFCSDKNFDFSSVFSRFGFEPNEVSCLHFGLKNVPQELGVIATVFNSSVNVRTSVQHITGLESGEGACAEFAQFILDHGYFSQTDSTFVRKAAGL